MQRVRFTDRLLSVVTERHLPAVIVLSTAPGTCERGSVRETRYPPENEKSGGRRTTSGRVRESENSRKGKPKKGCDKSISRGTRNNITLCLIALTICCVTFSSCTPRTAGSRFPPALGDHISSSQKSAQPTQAREPRPACSDHV